MVRTYYPVIDGRTIPPEFLWLFAMISVFVFVVLIAVVLLTQRKYATDPVLSAVPPIPMAADYDDSLTPADRLQELIWLRELMDSPAYGESDQRPSS